MHLNLWKYRALGELATDKVTEMSPRFRMDLVHAETMRMVRRM